MPVITHPERIAPQNRLVWVTLALAAAMAVNPLQAAQERTWRFTVLLDQKEIGQHDFILREAGRDKDLTSTARYRVKVLFMEAYRYTHESVERFRDGCLASIEARTDDNGKALRVTGQRTSGITRITADAYQFESRDCMLTFAYWSPDILLQQRLLNAQTGEYQDIKVIPVGTEPVDLPEGRTAASRYRLTGRDLNIDLWYADGQRWVGLESRLANGRVLRYVPR